MQTQTSPANANLPQQITSFIGREDEIGKISQLLADPDCRLLTLLDPGGIGKTRLAAQATAVAVNYLVQVALRQKQFLQAQQLYQQYLVIYREIYDLGGLVRSLHGAGNTAVALDDWSTAVVHYHEALQIAKEMQWEPLRLSLLISLAALFQAAGELDKSAKIAIYVNHHPAAEQETRDRARILLKCSQRK